MHRSHSHTHRYSVPPNPNDCSSLDLVSSLLPPCTCTIGPPSSPWPNLRAIQDTDEVHSLCDIRPEEESVFVFSSSRSTLVFRLHIAKHRNSPGLQTYGHVVERQEYKRDRQALKQGQKTHAARPQGYGAWFRKDNSTEGPGQLSWLVISPSSEAKITQAPFLTPLHYCTTASSRFWSHDQLSDFFYTLNSNYLEENSLSLPSETMISTECPFLPPHPTGPCPASPCAVWGQAKARAEWPIHWEALVDRGDRNS